ncbi:MAG: hypothetical protein ACRDKT_14975 [Actinomycetota bacterium]
MFGRAGLWMLVLALMAGLPAGTALAAGDDDPKVVLRRDDDAAEVVAVDDDDDGDDSTAATSGVDSNDGTNSRYTDVSRDRDRSRGDLTRDRTRDGGDRTRDWSRHHTNDRSRNDTR